MNVTDTDIPVEEVKQAIRQTNAIAKWIFGLIGAMFLMVVGWMWQISTVTATIIRAIDKGEVISESQAKDIGHLRGHADQAESIESALRMSLGDIEHRLAAIEGQAAQGARFTAKDGELMADRIRINGDRITALEQWRLRVESAANQRQTK